ncbi:MAG TPA: class I SAM-dependent methyltransferase [Nitrososphaeraceae archaeon]|nr:class I SAM-dependent methyltransferase [Nitrososphaeraceae archaeon]
MSGLGYLYWKQVLSTLRDIIPIYDKVNRVISFGKDDSYRYLGISENVRPGDLVLDAGSGFGNMSLIIQKIIPNNIRIIMYDPLLEMLKNSREHIIVESLSCGIFENIPFKDNSFDIVMCGYSLRDAINLETAISEIYRILKKGGRFIIVDLGKPDKKIIRLAVSIYLKYILKIFAYFIAGENGLKFKTLYGTYTKWPENQILYSLLKKNFSNVKFRKKMMGGSIIISSIK